MVHPVFLWFRELQVKVEEHTGKNCSHLGIGKAMQQLVFDFSVKDAPRREGYEAVKHTFSLCNP